MSDNPTNLIKHCNPPNTESNPIDDIFPNQMPSEIPIDNDSETSDMTKNERYFHIPEQHIPQKNLISDFDAHIVESVLKYRILYIFFIILGIGFFIYFRVILGNKLSWLALLLSSLGIFILYITAKFRRQNKAIYKVKCRYVDGEHTDSTPYLYTTVTFTSDRGSLIKTNYVSHIEFHKNKRYTALYFTPEFFVIKQDGFYYEILLASLIMFGVTFIYIFFGLYVDAIAIRLHDVFFMYV